MYDFVGISDGEGCKYPKQLFLTDYGDKKRRLGLEIGYRRGRRLYIPKDCRFAV